MDSKNDLAVKGPHISQGDYTPPILIMPKPEDPSDKVPSPNKAEQAGEQSAFNKVNQE